VVKYGVLFDDPKVEQYYEALLGTLKAAKKRGILNFKGQMLLKGPHDNEPVTLLVPPGDSPAPAPPATPPPSPPVASMAPASIRETPERTPPVVSGATSEAASCSPKAKPSGAAKAAASVESSTTETPSTSKYSTSKYDTPPWTESRPKPSAFARSRRSEIKPKTLEELMDPPTGPTEENNLKFDAINVQDPDAQCQFFLRSFIFALKDEWKEPSRLCKEFKKFSENETGGNCGGGGGMNHIQASGFLQRHGKTRTAAERNSELADVDINRDGRISFLEYLMLHYKAMILTEFYKRYEIDGVEDLTNDGIGITGVGYKLVDELLSMPAGLSPQIEAALEEFTESQRAREARIKELQDKAEKGGVKGMAARQELVILESGDDTETRRIELTLQAAKRRAAKNQGSQFLSQLEAKEEQDALKAKAEAKARMDARRAMFQGGGPCPSPAPGSR